MSGYYSNNGGPGSESLYKVVKSLDEFSSAYIIEKTVKPFSTFFWKNAKGRHPTEALNSLRSIGHPAIVGIFKADFTINNQTGVLLYYMKNGSLNDILSDKIAAKFTPDIKMRTIYGIASAFCKLHSNNIFLGSLDARHVLYDDHYYPQIVDLCALTQYQPQITPYSSIYLSQNAIHSGEFCEKDDCYTFGVLLYQILTGDMGRPSTFNDSIPNSYKLLIGSCLTYQFDQGDAFRRILNLLSNNDYLLDGVNVEKFEKYCHICMLSIKSPQNYEDEYLLAKNFIKRNNGINGIPILGRLVNNRFLLSYLLTAQILIEGQYFTQDKEKAYSFLENFAIQIKGTKEHKIYKKKYQFVETLYNYYFNDPKGKSPKVLIDYAKKIKDAYPKTALKCFRIAANDGYYDGMHYYAIYLYNGDGVEKDEEMAKSYLLKGAQNNHIPSINTLVTILEKEGKLEESYFYLKKSADLNCPESMYKYAMLIRDHNPDVSRLYLKRAADLNDQSALMQYASDLSDINDYNGASEYYLKAASKLPYEAMLKYGEMTEKMGNIPHAKEIYRQIINLPKNADLPNYQKIFNETKFHLAVCLYNEDNINREAIKTFQEVYDDFPEALTYLIKITESLKLNEQRLKYTKIAASYGIEECMEKYYEETKDTEFLKNEADGGNAAALGLYSKITNDINYIKLGVEKGNTEAIYLYGCYLDQNDDHKAAIEYFEKAAHKGHIKANLVLGIAYLNGWIVEKNEEMAKNYLSNAQDDMEAYLILFEYINGRDKIPPGNFDIFRVMK